MAFPPALRSVHSANSVQSFGEMVTLNTLILDARLLTLELLDAIGDLPLLRVLKLQNALVDELFGDDVQPRRGKFPSLIQLKIRGEIDLLNDYFEAYFSFDPISLIKLNVFLESTPIYMVDLAFLENLSWTLEEIELDMFKSESPLQFRHLDRFTACRELTSIKVTHCLFISFQGFDATRLGCCQNLTILDLRKRYDGILLLQEDLPLDPRELTRRQPDGADIYLLGILAENLPRLIELYITIVASPTRDHTQEPVPFQRLEFLMFGPGSFINHQQPGFDENEAARYISNLVLPETIMDTDFIDAYEHPMRFRNGVEDLHRAWDRFMMEHQNFKSRFWRRILDYVEARDM